jgi:hypothetical protein
MHGRRPRNKSKSFSQYIVLAIQRDLPSRQVSLLSSDSGG